MDVQGENKNLINETMFRPLKKKRYSDQIADLIQEITKIKKKLSVMGPNWVAEWSKKGIPAKKILDAVQKTAKSYR